MKGKLIVFEGISGTGKETQAKLLQNYLTKKKTKSHIVFHPSPELKSKLQREKSISVQIALLVRDRSDRVKDVIKPSLKRGEWIISLRNYISAMVYQGATGKEFAKFEPKPDYLFYFEIRPQVAMKRIVSRGETRGKFERISLLDEKQKKYEAVLQRIPHIRIDASRTIDEIHEEVVKYIV